MTASQPCTTCLIAALLVLLSFVTTISAQQLAPSNATSDLSPYDSSPRFWVNGTGNPSSSSFQPFRVAPLGWYSQISQQNFLGIQITGRLIYVDPSNANQFVTNAFDYVSCDPEDYPGELGPNDVLRMVVNTNQGNTVILYSTTANHCQAGALQSLPVANGIFTTLDPGIAATVLAQLRNSSSIGMPGVVNPDVASYTKPYSSSSGSSVSQSGTSSGPTTAVAMIILYTITGIITALFVVIIVTGAIRAHRNPDRYGPSNVAGRPRRSRAKGIARAMLDTIPIVKFGEHKDEPGTPKNVGDIEMVAGDAMTPPSKDNGKNATTEVAEAESGADEATLASTSSTVPKTNADGTDETGQLGCSICTEDFAMGDEVRVLPCNHKFHPECVDPWLLNVSGTCPLCRIDLQPKEDQATSAADGELSASRRGSTAALTAPGTMHDVAIAPPLGHLPFRLDRDRVDRGERRLSNVGRRDTIAFMNLRSVASGSREDRIAALRRFRQQRRNRGESEADQPEEERRGLSSRLRERFRIRTRRLGEDEVGGAATSAAAPSAGLSSTTTQPLR